MQTGGSSMESGGGSSEKRRRSARLQSRTPLSDLTNTPSSQRSPEVFPEHCCSVQYSQRSALKRKHKGKACADAEASSCPPATRIRSIGEELKVDHDDPSLTKAFSVPRQKREKKRNWAMPEPVQMPTLPQDFVEKQRAYYAQIDAFELPEEEVSESELE